MEDLPDILVRSLADAEREIPKLDASDAIVSIGAPETQAPDGFDHENDRHLRLEFDDVATDRPQFGEDRVRPPRKDHIIQLVENAETLLEAELVYCHCAAGVSRSSAAAYILHCFARDHGEESEALEAVKDENPHASPNSLMVEYADEVLERSGNMMDALQSSRTNMAF
ncbi:MAG: hypothetical protein ABEL76_09035 [Bradymonadaceae bacterium]